MKYSSFFKINIALIAIMMVCCKYSNPTNGQFSKMIDVIEEPQTDDERTLIGDFKDLVAYADSLDAIKEGTDTLNLRRLFFMICQQRERVLKDCRFQNIRKLMSNKIKESTNTIDENIKSLFPKKIREEWYDFYYYIYECSAVFDAHRPYIGEKVHVNTLGEHYVLRKDFDGQYRKVPVYFKDEVYKQEKKAVKLKKITEPEIIPIEELRE